MYKTICPNCGTAGSLYVCTYNTRGDDEYHRVWIPLTADGFRLETGTLIGSGQNDTTWGEQVVCEACSHHGPIGQFAGADDEPTIAVPVTLFKRMWGHVEQGHELASAAGLRRITESYVALITELYARWGEEEPIEAPGLDE